MNEHTERFGEEAGALASALLNPEVSSNVDALFQGLRPGLYIGDVHEEAVSFRRDAEVARSMGAAFPVLRLEDGGVAPVALSPLLGLPEDPTQSASDLLKSIERQTQDDRNGFYEALKEFERSAPSTTAFRGVEEAENSLKRGLADFLATRISTVVEFFQRPRGASGLPFMPMFLPTTPSGQTRVQTVGFDVDVHSSHGLRIHVSTSFRINWRYFGKPSSPIFGKLPGGIYRFAADGGPYRRITPDRGTFDIPYTTLSPGLNL